MEKEELFRRFLDGELNEEEEQQALHMIADNQEMRDLLRFERTLFQSFNREPDPAAFEVPDQFSEAVMQQLPQIESEKRVSVFDRAHGWMADLLEPRQLVLRPVYLMAAILLVAGGLGYGLLTVQPDEQNFTAVETGSSTQTVAETESEIWIRFVYFDEEAEQIEVAGDFSDWEPVPLDEEVVDGRRVWTGLVPMPRGEHRYMFVKDGVEWVTDPLASVQRDDGFGNKNAVLYL